MEDPELTTALALGLCPWCARWLTDDCGHQMPILGPIERHRIELPYPDYPRYPALHANLRGNRWDTNRDVQAVRGDVSRLARYIRPGKRVIVHLAWKPRTKAGQDEDGLWPLFKAICDGLARGARRPTLRNPGMAIGLDLVPGDTPEYMTRMAPVILPDGPPGMWLTVGVIR